MQNPQTNATTEGASPVLRLPTPMSTGNPKKRLFLFIAIPLIVLLIGSIFGLVLYQNTVNQTNAHNAYLSSSSSTVSNSRHRY